MKKRIALPLILSASLAITACNSPTNTSKEKNETAQATSTDTTPGTSTKTPATISSLDDDVLVVINGQPITKEMYALYFQDRTKSMQGDKQSPEMQMNVLNELANVILITQDAEAKKLPDETNIANALTLARSSLLAQAAIQHHISNNAPSNGDIQALYKKRYSNDTPKEYKARHILLEDESAASGIIEQLKQGGDFATLAQENSTGPSASAGGDLGWFESDRMVPAFAQAVQAMSKGTFSSTPVQTQYGWHIIQLEDTRDIPKPPLNEVRGPLEQELQREVMAKYIENLRNNAKIIFNDKMAKKRPAETQSPH